ncbi:MAG: OmpA family protein [Gammaproteobacteria bacterium]|nr:OmpA family protein [Gammaproteobacteria bacterium]
MGSAADLMTGLLFVFIIMVAFLALQKKSEQEARIEQQAKMEQQAKAEQRAKAAQAKAEEQARAAQAKAEDQARAEQQARAKKQALLANERQEARAGDRDPRGLVTETIGEEIRTILPSITVDPASGVITLPEDLLFDRGSAELKATAAEKLAETSRHLTEVLKCFVSNQRLYRSCPNNPEGHEIETIFIEGHTDSVPMPSPGGNIKLSLDRATSVNAALVGESPLIFFKNKDDYPIFSYSAYGESRPLIKADTTDYRNRRVDLRIVLTYRPSQSAAPVSTAQAAVNR